MRGRDYQIMTSGSRLLAACWCCSMLCLFHLPLPCGSFFQAAGLGSLQSSRAVRCPRLPSARRTSIGMSSVPGEGGQQSTKTREPPRLLENLKVKFMNCMHSPRTQSPLWYT